MKPLLLILAHSFPWQNTFAEKSLPKISPDTMEKIQRLSLVLYLTEYPQTQDVVMKYLSLLPYSDLGGTGGSDIQFHRMIALTDTEDPKGYYGINIYFGENRPSKEHEPLIAGAEVFFQPVYSEKFMPELGQFFLKNPYRPRVIEIMRELMHKLKRTPSEFVQQLAENGLPSDQMQKELDSLSAEKRASEESTEGK